MGIMMYEEQTVNTGGHQPAEDSTKDLRKSYLTARARADNAALNISNSIGCIEAFCDKDLTWGDVGSMNHFAEKLEEILWELESYEQAVTEDGAERVGERRINRAAYNSLGSRLDYYRALNSRVIAAMKAGA